MRIITISGKAGHGKDTSAQLLKEQLEENGHRVLITHYADLLKYICRQCLCWNGKKDTAGRELLQYVGTEVVRERKPDFWVNFVADIVELFPDMWDFVLIPDCRFPNEINVLKRRGIDTVHLRVVRPGYQSLMTSQQQAHPSETALDNTKPDFYLQNDGTLDGLRKNIADLLPHLDHSRAIIYGQGECHESINDFV